MTNSELWDALYDWISSVLEGVEVVESHQDAPATKGTYIAIDYAGNWRFAGTTPNNRIDGTPSLVSPRVYIYRGSVQVREIGGDGEALMRIVESLDDKEFVGSFGKKGFSVLNTSGPVALPSLDQSRWRRESVLTLELSWARAYAGDNLTIESVSIERTDKDTGEVLEEIQVDSGWEPEPEPEPEPGQGHEQDEISTNTEA